ncbi:MAG: SOS response-associated peptidase [Myxococcales bacterium]|nr:SOS response-associated peptidase [Myxococcales bacterium]
MCGRYTRTEGPDEWSEVRVPWRLSERLRAGDPALAPRYNIAPSQIALVVRNLPAPVIEALPWGLVPSWSTDPTKGSRPINARAETLHEKPSFREPFRRRRCVVLADGFYEWKREGGGKVPYFIRLMGGETFALAGLWDEHGSPDAPLRTFAIVTTTPNEVLAPIHDRMPVILDPESYDRWLDPSPRAPRDLAPLLRPYPAARMEAYIVSTMVGSVATDGPACIEPIGTPAGNDARLRQLTVALEEP